MAIHSVGMTWHPIQADRRFQIALQWCGYSVPMYCSRFGGELIGVSRTLDKAAHVCETVKNEREQALSPL